MPAAVFAAPRAEDVPDINRQPTDQPKAAGQECDEEMNTVVEFVALKDLIVLATPTIGANSVSSHPFLVRDAFRRIPRLPYRIIGIMSPDAPLRAQYNGGE
jgi:hypothetical protein